MTAQPDIAGFREAQSRLRDVLGVDVDFHIPVAPTYPAGTQLDPETGRPFDPTIRPESENNTTVTRRVSVVARPIPRNVEDPINTGWGGLRRGESAALSMDPDVYDDVRNATSCTIQEINYRITELIRDPGLDDRYIAYLEAR